MSVLKNYQFLILKWITTIPHFLIISLNFLAKETLHMLRNYFILILKWCTNKRGLRITEKNKIKEAIYSFKRKFHKSLLHLGYLKFTLMIMTYFDRFFFGIFLCTNLYWHPNSESHQKKDLSYEGSWLSLLCPSCLSLSCPLIANRWFHLLC